VLAGSACAASANGALGGQASVTAAPACRASQLKALFRGFNANGGTLTGAVVLIDTGDEPCWLTGTPPSVALLNDGGDTVAVRSRPLAVPVEAGPVELAPGTELPEFGAPPTRGSAWFLVTWTNWCGDAGPGVQSLLVVLPGGGSVAAPLDAAVPTWVVGRTAPRCEDGKAASTVTIGRFQASAA
jgi:Protein of unknown function (DUF4232)